MFHSPETELPEQALRMTFPNGFFVEIRWDAEDGVGSGLARISCGSKDGLITIDNGMSRDTEVWTEAIRVVRLASFLARLTRKTEIDLIDLTKLPE